MSSTSPALLLFLLCSLLLLPRFIDATGRGEDPEDGRESSSNPNDSKNNNKPLCMHNTEKQQINCVSVEEFNEMSVDDSCVTLTIRGTDLSQLPKSLRKLQALKNIYLVSNANLRSLPSSLLRGIKLEGFFVGKTPIEEIPESFCSSFASLKTFGLMETSVEDIPACVFASSQLRLVALVFNEQLTSFPASGVLKTVTNVGLDHTSFAALINRVPSVQTVSIYTSSERPRLPQALRSLNPRVSVQRLEGIRQAEDKKCSGKIAKLPDFCFEKAFEDVQEEFLALGTSDRPSLIKKFISNLLKDFRFAELYELASKVLSMDDGKIAEQVVIDAASNKEFGLTFESIVAYPFTNSKTRDYVEEQIKNEKPKKKRDEL